MNHQPSKRSFTYHQQETMWHLWSQGKSLSEIGRQLNKHAGSVFCYLQKSGGIKPLPAKRSARDVNQRRIFASKQRQELQLQFLAD